MLARLYVMMEREAATARADSSAQRTVINNMERAFGERLERMRAELAEQLGSLSGSLGREQAEARAAQSEALRNMAEASAQQLSAIRHAVTEQLHEAVERQMHSSFQRVLEQFTAMQKAMGEVRAMTARSVTSSGCSAMLKPVGAGGRRSSAPFWTMCCHRGRMRVMSGLGRGTMWWSLPYACRSKPRPRRLCRWIASSRPKRMKNC